ncbi:MAG: hypothetical protein RIE32_08815 [Phycisphaerales bacterium]
MKGSIIATFAVLATSAIAAADTVTMNFVGAGHGRTATIRVDGDRYTVHAGQLIHDVTARSGSSAPGLGQLTTYCVDVAEWVSYQSRVYNVNELTDAPVSHGNAGMDQHKADAVGRLYSYANGQQYGADNNFAAAFQLAVWEVVSDLATSTTALNVADGDFQAWNLNSGTISYLNTLLGVAVDDDVRISDRVLALTNDGSQDQMFEVAVPLPTTGAMAAVGLAGAGFFGRRRRA